MIKLVERGNRKIHAKDGDYMVLKMAKEKGSFEKANDQGYLE